MVEEISLKNISLNEDLPMNMLNTPYCISLVDWGQIQASHYTYKYINQVGRYVMGTSLETRAINIEGWIIAENDEAMTYRKGFLNRFVNPQNLIRITYKNYELDFIPDSTVIYATNFADNNNVICKFQIIGTSYDPIFKDKYSKTIYAATTMPKFHFPLIISDTPDPPGGVLFGVRTNSVVFDVNNLGNITNGMKIIFVAKGTVLNPSLVNASTFEFFKIDKELESGEQITINTSTGEKTITGFLHGLESNYFRYKNRDSSWLQLNVGVNTFVYDADENLDNLEVYISYQDKYLEVQQCY